MAYGQGHKGWFRNKVTLRFEIPSPKSIGKCLDVLEMFDVGGQIWYIVLYCTKDIFIATSFFPCLYRITWSA
jgi:hypothetical protein